MLAANLDGVETPSSSYNFPDASFVRGLRYSLLLSVPIWAVIIAVARIVI